MRIVIDVSQVTGTKLLKRYRTQQDCTLRKVCEAILRKASIGMLLPGDAPAPVPESIQEPVGLEERRIQDQLIALRKARLRQQKEQVA